MIPSSKTTAIDPKAVSVLPPAASSDDLHRPFSSEVVVSSPFRAFRSIAEPRLVPKDLDSNTLGSTELSCTTALFESGIGKTDAGEGCASQEDLSNSGSVGIKRSECPTPKLLVSVESIVLSYKCIHPAQVAWKNTAWRYVAAPLCVRPTV